MRVRPSFSYFPANCLDPESTAHILRMEFTLETGQPFDMAVLLSESTGGGFVELKNLVEVFDGMKTACEMLDKRILEMMNPGLTAEMPSSEIAAKADA